MQILDHHKIARVWATIRKDATPIANRCCLAVAALRRWPECFGMGGRFERNTHDEIRLTKAAHLENVA